MNLITINANFDRITAAVERIANDLSHGIRILESAFPLAPSARWEVKSNQDIRIVDDAVLIEREDEEERKRQQLGEEDSFRSGEYDL